MILTLALQSIQGQAKSSQIESELGELLAWWMKEDLLIVLNAKPLFI